MPTVTESVTTVEVMTPEVVTPMLHILPELLEMGQEPNSTMSMVQLKVDFPEASAMPLTPTPSPSEPTLPLAFVERGGLDVVVPRSPESTRQEVSLDEEVVVSGALAQVPGAIFARKLYDFLINLEADDPGSGKMIGCLLDEREIRNNSKKVGSSVLKEKSFKGKTKKSGSTRKAYVAAS
jgi:hypothetical protein